MFKCLCSGLRLVACVAIVPIAHAQPVPRAPGPDPLDPRAEVPRADYQSPFTAYRRQGEPVVGSWRAANDEVARIGGWRAYAREASRPEPAAPAAAAASAPAATPPRP